MQSITINQCLDNIYLYLLDNQKDQSKATKIKKRLREVEIAIHKYLNGEHQSITKQQKYIKNQQCQSAEDNLNTKPICESQLVINSIDTKTQEQQNINFIPQPYQNIITSINQPINNCITEQQQILDTIAEIIKSLQYEDKFNTSFHNNNIHHFQNLQDKFTICDQSNDEVEKMIDTPIKKLNFDDNNLQIKSLPKLPTIPTIQKATPNPTLIQTLILPTTINKICKKKIIPQLKMNNKKQKIQQIQHIICQNQNIYQFSTLPLQSKKLSSEQIPQTFQQVLQLRNIITGKHSIDSSSSSEQEQSQQSALKLVSNIQQKAKYITNSNQQHSTKQQTEGSPLSIQATQQQKNLLNSDECIKNQICLTFYKEMLQQNNSQKPKFIGVDIKDIYQQNNIKKIETNMQKCNKQEQK